VFPLHLQLQQYEGSEDWLANDKSRKEYSFDYFFDKATQERQETKSRQQKVDPDYVDIDQI
jgi:hypothetical protein